MANSPDHAAHRLEVITVVPRKPKPTELIFSARVFGYAYIEQVCTHGIRGEIRKLVETE